MVGIRVCEGGGVFGREMGQCGYHGPLDQGLHCSALPPLPSPRLLPDNSRYSDQMPRLISEWGVGVCGVSSASCTLSSPSLRTPRGANKECSTTHHHHGNKEQIYSLCFRGSER